MSVIQLRPELAHHLQQRVQALRDGFRHNLALIGPPGSGKTFQLRQLLGQHSSALLLIYCPLYREPCRSFLTRFLCAVLEAGLVPAEGSKETSRADAPSHTYQALLTRAEAQLPKTAAAIRAIEPLLTRRLYSDAYNRALDTLPILSEERQQPCVLMLDEFLFLEDLGFVHAFHELGKRVMTWSSTLFILTSSAPFRARTILRERLQLLFGQFELLSLDTLNRDSTAAWIRQELKGLRGTNTVSPFLIRWLGASPWYLTLVLKRLKELATIARAPQLSEPLFVQTLWDLLGSQEGALHQWCVSRTDGLAHARVGSRAMEALIQIADGARTTTEIGKRIGRGGLTAALQLLVEHDLAQRNGMCWIVADPILRCWLSTVVHAQRADARLDGAERRDRFDRYIRSVWTQWLQAHELSFSDQIAELFSKFRDDTVSLDSKTGRLPHFHTIQPHRPQMPSSGGVYLVADGEGKRWCASVQEERIDENAIALFDAFCRGQSPRPGRKVVIAKAGMDDNARLFAKTVNMWVWEPDAVNVLMELYGHAG